ncbi:hypothetical protein [Blastopirellula retiformator]|uniref:Uncharacterized protein n=1 Tax=Blastopirellula retiformator TaxID=2527970 RepID=A0A5C5V4H8_9BACT|nr:hypothetical protein [Blastopirellula retiformator]TWT32605.1 hypothetical protein Enr8_24100 [Blastopirellula retiformator]
MHTQRLLLVLVGFLFCTGCFSGPGSEGVGVTDPEVGKTVQSQVENFVTVAQKSPRAAKGNLDLMLESLDGAADRGEGFAKVRDEAKKLQSMYQAKAKDAKLKAQMQTLKTTADALVPGSN